MLLTTTNSVEGKTISTYYGMVTGEAIIGANIFKEKKTWQADTIKLK